MVKTAPKGRFRASLALGSVLARTATSDSGNSILRWLEIKTERSRLCLLVPRYGEILLLMVIGSTVRRKVSYHPSFLPPRKTVPTQSLPEAGGHPTSSRTLLKLDNDCHIKICVKSAGNRAKKAPLRPIEGSGQTRTQASWPCSKTDSKPKIPTQIRTPKTCQKLAL